jgi:hypothetical protein
MVKLRYAEALAKYDEAYALSADPVMLYNSGRALEAMTRFPEALDRLTRFKATAAPELLARVPTLDKLLAQVEGQTCLFEVRVNLPGATVRLDDQVLGVSPLARMRLNARAKARLEITLEGYTPVTRELELPSAGSQSLRVDLLPRDDSATIRVETNVVGASLVVDGAERGGTPAELRLRAGRHVLTVGASEYADSTTELTVEAGRDRTVSIELSESPVYARWWFWATGGAVLVGGLATGLGVAFTSERAPDRGTIDPGTTEATSQRRGASAARAIEIAPIPIATFRF